MYLLNLQLDFEDAAESYYIIIFKHTIYPILCQVIALCSDLPRLL